MHADVPIHANVPFNWTTLKVPFCKDVQLQCSDTASPVLPLYLDLPPTAVQETIIKAFC